LRYLVDPVVTPESFAQSVVDDYNLSSNYHSLITKSIQDQLSDFKAHSANLEDSPVDDDNDPLHMTTTMMMCTGTLDDEDAAWWESWRKRLRTDSGGVRKLGGGGGGGGGGKQRRKRQRIVDGDEADDEKPMDVDDFVVDEKKIHDDMRILVKVPFFGGFDWDGFVDLFDSLISLLVP
jgi:SWI/SNF-related matrix-associated actin-dependent regulator of chromatin subfamily B member 1